MAVSEGVAGVSFTRDDRADERILIIVGELDIAIEERLREELWLLIEEARIPCSVDLSRVSFLDSSGTRALVLARRAAVTSNVSLGLRDPSAACRKVLELAGLWDELEIRESD